MSSILSNCSCSTFKSVGLQFTPPSVAPLYNYEVQWRTVDSYGYPGLWNIENKECINGTITLNAIPTCCNVVGTVKAKCGENQYGQSASFTIPASATYNANIIFVSCTQQSGIGNYTLSGVAGQSIKLRLTFEGVITYNNTNSGGLNSQCAWLYGKITGPSANASGTSSGTDLGSTTPKSVNIGNSVEVTLVMDPSGSMSLSTELVAYNVTSASLTTLNAGIQIVSVDGVPVTALPFAVSCRRSDTMIGCAPAI